MSLLKRIWNNPTANLSIGIIFGILGFFSVMVWGETFRPTEKTPLDLKIENVSLKIERDRYVDDLYSCLRGELTSIEYFQP